MRTDSEIRVDVMAELGWTPYLSASEIGVTVKDGVVTLSGHVDSYSKKLSAEHAAKRVSGVRAIAEDIQVGVSPGNRKSDAELAEAVLLALKWHTSVEEEKIMIRVENGIVKLEGAVDWDYQRDIAKSAIENIVGVRSVINLIKVEPKVIASEIQQKINAAFLRSATIDADKILVEVAGGKVTLHGSVRSFSEKADAEKAAWASPGVFNVISKLELKTPELAWLNDEAI